MGSVISPNFEEWQYFSVDSLSDFINTLKTYPSGTAESDLELLRRYRAGDMEARDLLVKTSLRLILKEAKKYTTHSYELLDVINEGIIGFLEAIERYDFLYNVKLSTFVMPRVRGSILNALAKNDHQIRRPQPVAAAVRDYYSIVKVCKEEGKNLPTDDEYCEMLNVTEDKLKLIKTDYQLNTSSLNEKVGEDGEEELEAFVPSEEASYDGILDRMEEKSAYLAIKLLFPPFYYYVLYNRVFSPSPKSQEEIAKQLFASRETIRKAERVCLEQLRKIIEEYGSIYDLELPADLRRHVDDTNIAPVSPDLIAQYFFFRDSLLEEERQIFKLLITSNYLPNDDRFSRELGMNVATYRGFYKSLMKKINLNDNQKKKIYTQFKNAFMKKYGYNIFSIDLDGEIVELDMDADSVAEVWDSFNYREIMDIVAQNNIALNPRMNDLLKRYFNGGKENFPLNAVSKRRAKREVNAMLFGFHKKNEITITGLFDALTSNRHRFTLNQYDYLMARKFQQDNLKDRGIVKVSELGDLRELSRRLEKIHYGISRYRELNFTKEKYESIRDKCIKKLSSDKISILDMFYGVESSKYSIQQIAAERHVSYEEARADLQEAKRCALRVYLGRYNTRIIDAELYIPYVLDETIDLSDETRTMLREFLIEKKSYEEIEAIHGIDRKNKKEQRKVATIIGNGLQKIDFYRFGIFKANLKYTNDECKKIFASLSLTDEERKVIQLKMDGKTKEAIMAETELTFIRVSYILDKFYKICDKYRVASVVIDEADIEREVNAHVSEMVLNVKERLMLARLYGITCDVNPTGVRLTEEEFRIAHPNMSKQYKKILRDALNTVRAKKAGFTRASLAYMSRSDLKLSLKDPRIPISQEERELLYYSFELEGYPYKTLKELEKMFGGTAATLKRKIEVIFSKIYKYENDELPPSISYEYDVEPYLKYFSKSDQEVLKDLYANKLTYEEIGQKHELTKGQVETLILSLDAYLRDLIDGEISGYDFDYFWSVVDWDTVPFYGNKAKTKNVFYLYYEKRMSVDEIINYLGLSCKRKVVTRAITELMIAVSKRREGIKKVNCPKQSEIREYYDKNSSEMDFAHRQMYQQYLDYLSQDRKKSTLYSFSQPNVPLGIILDLIEENNDDVFSFEKTSREEVLAIIKSHKEISQSTFYTLLKAYHISQRELMSGSEKMKVLRFLSELKINSKVLSLRKTA